MEALFKYNILTVTYLNTDRLICMTFDDRLEEYGNSADVQAEERQCSRASVFCQNCTSVQEYTVSAEQTVFYFIRFSIYFLESVSSAQPKSA